MLLLMVFAAVIAVTQLTLLGSWGRSLRLSTILQGIAVGFLVCGFATVTIQFAWTRLAAAVTSVPVSEVQALASWTLDPFIEEIVKVAPLLLLAWLRPRVQRQLGYTDHLLYGAALGIGFELLEGALRYARLGFSATGLGDRYVVDGGFFGIVTVPTLWTSLFTWQPVPASTEILFSSGGDTIQHLVWTALAAVGVTWLVRRKDHLRLLGLAPLLLASLDHANFNLRVQQPPPLSGWWSDALAWVGSQLSWVLVIALVAAVIADRVIQARGRALSPVVLLLDESGTGLRPIPVIRSAMAGFPFSAWVTWQVVLSRRAAMTTLTAGETDPHLRDGVVVAVAQLGRVAAVPRAEAAGLWRTAVARVWSGFNLRALRSPRMLIWAIALLPAWAYLVIGAYPETKWLQQAMNSQVGLWLLVASVVAGSVLIALQLRPMVTALRGVVEPSLHERRIRLQARFATALASLGGAGVLLAIALLERDPATRLARSFHVLDALSNILLVLGLALIVASFFMFPPVGLMALAGGGAVLVPTAVAGTFVISVTAGAILTSLGLLMSEAAGSQGSGSGGGSPPRYTSNSGGITRTYGRSVSDIKGQASRWARRMEARGFKVVKPPVRSPSPYGHSDVTVSIYKNGVLKGIRHFIFRG